MSGFLNTVWELLNEPAALTIIGGAFLWVLNRIYAAKPAWAEYEGTIISAIKFAEKMVPDGSENKSVSKLNTALKYALTVYKNTHNGKEAPKKLVQSLAQGIQIKHEAMEEKNTLKPADQSLHIDSTAANIPPGPRLVPGPIQKPPPKGKNK